MRAAKSFIEVLEAQVRTDLRKEIEAEVRAEYGFEAATTSAASTESREAQAAGRFETWMAANIESSYFTRSFGAQNAYKAPQRREQSKAKQEAPVARKTATTAAELMAVELLRRESGTSLLFTFSHDELKTAWKKAALKTHPDRFSQEDEATIAQAKSKFQDLVEAHQVLEAMF